MQQNVYLRGTVLTRYQDGQWVHQKSGPRMQLGLARSVARREIVELVRQKITIEPMGRSDLFCVWPFIYLRRNDHVSFNAQNERMVRSQAASNRRFTYELGTTAFVDGVQTDLSPCEVDPGRILLQWPSRSLPGLAALAEQWISESGIPPNDPIGRARHLQSRLRDSGQFSYSSEEPDRDSSLDPVEDFVVRHPRGNCEFFASALTLMLRSQGIPARVVVGFNSGEYSHLNQAYIVRNSHTHAWVEAFIPSDHLGETPRQDDPLCDWS